MRTMCTMHTKCFNFFSLHNYINCNYNTMSFLGHPVCHLGLNWCILLGLFIVFPALAKCSCCLLFPLGNQNMGKSALKRQYSFAYKIKYLQKKIFCLKRHYGKLLGFWGHYTVYFSYFVYKMFLFAITALISSFSR